MVSQVAEVQAVIGKQYVDKVLPLIKGANLSIKILVFDWRWYPDHPHSNASLFNQAILGAKKRGVTVQAVLNMADIVRQLRGYGIDARKVISKDLLHTKLMIIDDKVCILGSHNYTASAFDKNYECSAIIRGAENVEPFLAYFDVIFTYNGNRNP